MEYNMFLPEIKASKGKGKQKEIKYFLTCTSSTVLDPELFEVYRQSPTDFKRIWFRARRRRKKRLAWQHTHWHHGSVGMHRALPRAMCVYQMFSFPRLPLGQAPSSRTSWKDLKYSLVCIYLTENISVLPEDLRVKSWFSSLYLE